MKILITGSSVDYGVPAFFLKAFRELGADVEIFDDEGCHEKQTSILKNRCVNRFLWKFSFYPIQKKFLEFCEKVRPDLVFVMKGYFFSPKTLYAAKGMLPESLFFCFNTDNPFNVWHFGASNSWIRKSISFYDVFFTWGKFLIEKLENVGGKNVEYLPFGYDLGFHYPVESQEDGGKLHGSDVVFIGTWDKEREKVLSCLLDYNLAIWGNDWHRAGKVIRNRWKKRTVIGEEFSRVCNSSKIVLNLIRKQNIPAHNMKTFEIPACRGFMLATGTKEQAEFFEEGREIACFSTPYELKEKIEFYLSRNSVRKQMSEKAYEKVAEHTYLNRAKRVLETYQCQGKVI